MKNLLFLIIVGVLLFLFTGCDSTQVTRHAAVVKKFNSVEVYNLSDYRFVVRMRDGSVWIAELPSDGFNVSSSQIFSANPQFHDPEAEISPK